MAGVIDMDWELASFSIGEKVCQDDIGLMNGNIIILETGKLFIPRFIEFQYGTIKPDSSVHKGVVKTLIGHGIPFPHPYDTLKIGCAKGMHTLKDKDKDKDKDKNKNKEGSKEGSKHQSNSMPLDGWDVDSVVRIAESPDCGVIPSMARSCFDHYAAAEWHDKNGNPVGRTVNSLKALLRKWKANKPSMKVGKITSEPDCEKCGWPVKLCQCGKVYKDE